MDYVLIFISLINQVLGSVGDLSWYYRSCTDECRVNYSCPLRFDSCLWCSGSCFRCRYGCMWGSVEHFMKQGGFVHQFHGKWPFIAIYLSIFDSINVIVQEPASFMFSMVNFYAFFLFYKKIMSMEQLENHRTWVIYALVGLVTWLCSAIYHARDCWFTEYLDYFSAFAFILCASYTSFCFSVSSLRPSSNNLWNISSLYGSLLIFWFAMHVFHMMQHFDYGYNMRCCISVSLFTTAMYLVYIASRWKRFRRFSRSDRMLMVIIAWTNGTVIFETLDFPPIFWVFDAHSLFHASTIPLPSYLIAFLQEHLLEDENLRFKNV